MQSFSVTLCALVLLLGAVNFFGVDCYTSYKVSEYEGRANRVIEYIRRNYIASSEPSALYDAFVGIVQSSSDHDEKDFYKALIDINSQTGSCTLDMVNYSYSIMLLAEKYPNEQAVQDYFGYLKQFGGAKFGDCAQITGERFERLKGELMPAVEQVFDELYTLLSEGSVQAQDDASLAAVAKDVDLSSYTFKSIKKVVKLAKKDFPYESRPEKSVWYMFDRRCDQLLEPFKAVFGAYNLAKDLGAQVPTNVSTKFVKLNEYNRACLSWQKARDVSRTNVEHQVDESKWYKKVLKA